MDKFKLKIILGLFMTEYYFDIETTGWDPVVDKIITIQWQKLSYGRGVGPVNILKEWESSEKEILEEFLPRFAANETVPSQVIKGNPDKPALSVCTFKNRSS